MVHSIIGGSRAHIWSQCDGYVRIVSDLPEEEPSEAAREGTAAHEIGAELIRAASAGRYPGWAEFDGQAATDGTPFTQEMFEAAEVYAQDVAAVMRKTGVFGGEHLFVETPLHARRIHEGAFGTPDVALYSEGALYLWDFKFGHRYVDPFENWQAVFYAAALFEHLALDGIADQFVRFEFRVVQPRVYHRDGIIQSWSTSGMGLRGLFNRLEAAAAAQFGPAPIATSGPHCRDCPGRFRCPAALQAGPELFEVAAQAVPQDPSPAALGLQLRQIKRALAHLGSLETAIEGQVEALIKRGESVPGWGYEPVVGRPAWGCSDIDVIAMGRAYGVDLTKPGVLTPNQAVKAGLPKEAATALTVRPNRGIKLVPDDGAAIKRIFEK